MHRATIQCSYATCLCGWGCHLVVHNLCLVQVQCACGQTTRQKRVSDLNAKRGQSGNACRGQQVCTLAAEADLQEATPSAGGKKAAGGKNAKPATGMDAEDLYGTEALPKVKANTRA